MDTSPVDPDHCGSETKVNICTKDNYAPYDRILTAELTHLAGDQKLDYNMGVFYRYGTDASTVIRAGNNVYAAAFGMGCFASHGIGYCHIQSIVQAAKLLYAYLLSE